jgi:hypothetical protein
LKLTQSRELIWNVFKYFEAQRFKSSTPGRNSIKRAAEATFMEHHPVPT